MFKFTCLLCGLTSLVALAAGTGTLIITSEEGWADVYLDDQPVGEIPSFGKPLTITSIDAGMHHLRITDFTGFSTWFSGRFTIAEGQTVRAKAEPGEFTILSATGGKTTLLTPPTQSSSDLAYEPLTFVNRGVIINSNPSGAIIYANDTRIGQTPFTHLNPNLGHFDIRIEAPNCQPWEGSIEVRRNYITKLEVTLAQTGSAYTTTPSQPELIPDAREGQGKLLLFVEPFGASIYVDNMDIPKGFASFSDATKGREFILSAGVHKVKVEESDDRPAFQDTIEIKGGQTTELRVNLEELHGERDDD